MINALIKVEKVLDFYDVPQLFTGIISTLYICVCYILTFRSVDIQEFAYQANV